MRILHVNTINDVANLHAEGLARRGHTSEVYAPSMRGAGAAWPIKAARLPERIFDLRRVVGDLHRSRAPRFDLVHIHWASYGVLGLTSRTPFIVQCHGSDVRERLAQPQMRALLAPILRRAAAVLCITPDLLGIVRTVRADALFFPAPIATARFAPPTLDTPGVTDMTDATATAGAATTRRPWTALLFTRLEAGKGAEIAARGLALFGARYPAARILLLDYGALSAAYQQRFGARFQFIARAPQEAVPALLAQADVVVGQFAVGALGLSELQAMSAGKPVIASFRYPDAYTQAPPIMQATTAEEVALRLEDLYTQPERAAALGREGRRWVVTQHDVDRVAARLERLYQQALDGTARSA